MNEQEIQKLKAAGFSDDDIRDYMADKQRQPQQPGVQTEIDRRNDQGPELDPNAPSETMARAREQGIPTEGQESSFIDDVMTVARVVLAENAGKVALGAGGLGAAYAANQIRKGMQTRAGAQAAQAAAQAAQAQATMEQARAAQQAAQGVQERFAQRQAAQAGRAAPVAPQILDAQGRPMARAPVAPVVPTGPAVSAPVVPQGPLPAGVTAGPAPFTPPQAPSIVDRATNLVRAIAANKVVQGAARMGNIAGIASMALSPSNSGQNYPFPQSGPLRGSEINPTTGQPWTPQELAQYRAQYGG